MDVVAEPPRIVVQGSESCPDSARVQALLRETLGDSRAPHRGWTLSFHVDGNTPHAVRAEGDIANDSGQSVAHRVLAGSVGDCDGMARAVGVWASLVLSQALARARADVLAPDGGIPHGPSSSGESAPFGTAPTVTGPAAQSDAPDAGGGWLPGAPPRSAPDSSADAHSGRTYEIGLGTFLMTGNGSNAIMGGSPYVFLEAARGFFLRPALSAGQSLIPIGDTGNSNALWLAARIDACTRVPGNYMRNNGLALDVCGGAEAGLTYYQAAHAGYTGPGAPPSATTRPLVAVGPSLDLLGELGNGWSVALRGVGGINVMHASFVDTTGSRLDPPLFSCRIELALAWRLR